MIYSLNNFQQRFLMSFMGIAFLAFLIIFSNAVPVQYLFVASLAFVQAKAILEYFSMAETKGYHPLKVLAVIASIIYIVLHFYSSDVSIAIPLLFVLIASAFIAHFSTAEQAICNMAITLFSIVYITLPLGFVLDIYFLPTSCWIVYLLVTTKITDTAAYIVGKVWGQRRLAPMLSPKKTMEGAIAGLVCTIITSLLFFVFWRSRGFAEGFSFSWFEASLLGAGIGIISQIGDLAESLLKRDANVKDSSKLPGFGGMLDIVDSMIFTTPFLYFCLKAKHLL